MKKNRKLYGIATIITLIFIFFLILALINNNKAPRPVDSPAKNITENQKNTVQYTGPPDPRLILVNKDHPLEKDYIPEDLIIPRVRNPYNKKLEKLHLKKEAASALESMFRAAEEKGLYIFFVSGYRSYKTQEYFYRRELESTDPETAGKYIAKPGQSEHQTGLGLDLSTHALGFHPSDDFADSPEGVWLDENAHKFGFIIRYPKGKENITRYKYEPWHLRYVGQEHAEKIKLHRLSLEEYLGL